MEAAELLVFLLVFRNAHTITHTRGGYVIFLSPSEAEFRNKEQTLNIISFHRGFVRLRQCPAVWRKSNNKKIKISAFIAWLNHEKPMFPIFVVNLSPGTVGE